jgi:hypothetical protein
MLMIDTRRFIISERTYVLARTGSPWHSKQMKDIPTLMGKYFMLLDILYTSFA